MRLSNGVYIGVASIQREEGKKIWQIKCIVRKVIKKLQVCGGIAQYFNIDSKFVRLICAALILIYGSGLLVYIILAIFIPKDPKR